VAWHVSDGLYINLMVCFFLELYLGDKANFLT
jgi:hypothetical protein